MSLPVKPLISKPVQYGLTGAALGGTLGLGIPYVSGTLDPSDYVRGGMMALTMGTGGMLRGRLTDLAERFTRQGEELAALRMQVAKQAAPQGVLGPRLYPKEAAPRTLQGAARNLTGALREAPVSVPWHQAALEATGTLTGSGADELLGAGVGALSHLGSVAKSTFRPPLPLGHERVLSFHTVPQKALGYAVDAPGYAMDFAAQVLRASAGIKQAAPWGRLGLPEALDLGLGALSAGQMANWALSDNMDAQHKPLAAALGAAAVGAGMTVAAPKVEALLARVQRPFWAGHWLNKATRELTQAAEQGNGEAAQMLAHISTPHGAQEVIDAQCRAVAQGAMPLARYGIGAVAAPLAVEAGQMASEQINPTFQDQVASTFGQARGVRRFWG